MRLAANVPDTLFMQETIAVGRVLREPKQNILVYAASGQ
jgi:hypothetical protein